MRRFALPITTNENLMNITRMTLAVTTGLLLTATAVSQPAPPAGRDIPVPLDRGNERLSEDNIGKAAVENAPKQPTVRPANEPYGR